MLTSRNACFRLSHRIVSAFLLIPCILWSTACNQNTIAALAQTLGNSAAQVATLENNPALAAKLTADTTAAVSAIQNWKSGSPATEAIEALNLVEDDLSLVPIASQYAPLIDLAIGTVESILSLLPQTQALGNLSAHTARRHVVLQNPPKTAAAFNKQFNAIAKQNGLAVRAK